MSLNILISRDNEIKKGLPECAIVTANYSVNGVKIGKAGVIGPIRMDYPKVVSVLDYIGKTINYLPEPKNKDKIDEGEIVGEFSIAQEKLAAGKQSQNQNDIDYNENEEEIQEEKGRDS